MKADRGSILRALDAPSPTTRLFLLYGPDEAASQALAKRLAKAMGEDADRTDLSGDQIAKDPAALVDAAASISLFGGASWVRVTGVGDESLGAVEALLAAPAAGNPVVLLAGALRKGSKLLTRCLEDPAALCFASYPPSERDAAELVIAMGRERGLRVDSGIARRIVEATSGERALMEGEVEKLALYHDAAPDRPVEASHDALDALSSVHAESDAPALASQALGGDITGLAHALGRYRGEGGSLAGVVRIALSKAMTTAEVRAALDSGKPRDAAFRVGGRPLWKAEAEEMTRLTRLWTGEAVGRAIERLGAAEKASRLSGALAETLLAEELLAVARQAARAR